jgi:hypothetical protein
MVGSTKKTKVPQWKGRLSVVSLGPKFPNSLVLEVQQSVLKKFGGKFNVRVECHVFLGRASTAGAVFNCALMPFGNGNAFIMLNKKRVELLSLKKGMRIFAVLVRDQSKYGVPLPDEFEEWLKQSKQDRSRFDQLSPGKRRSVIFFIASSKNSEGRLEKIAQVMCNLRSLPPGTENLENLFLKPPTRVE